jgi:hypothetical protein
MGYIYKIFHTFSKVGVKTKNQTSKYSFEELFIPVSIEIDNQRFLLNNGRTGK